MELTISAYLSWKNVLATIKFPIRSDGSEGDSPWIFRPECGSRTQPMRWSMFDPNTKEEVFQLVVMRLSCLNRAKTISDTCFNCQNPKRRKRCTTPELRFYVVSLLEHEETQHDFLDKLFQPYINESFPLRIDMDYTTYASNLPKAIKNVSCKDNKITKGKFDVCVFRDVLTMNQAKMDFSNTAISSPTKKRKIEEEETEWIQKHSSVFEITSGITSGTSFQIAHAPKIETTMKQATATDSLPRHIEHRI